MRCEEEEMQIQETVKLIVKNLIYWVKNKFMCYSYSIIHCVKH